MCARGLLEVRVDLLDEDRLGLCDAKDKRLAGVTRKAMRAARGMQAANKQAQARVIIIIIITTQQQYIILEAAETRILPGHSRCKGL
jgi:hypothetical protein